MKLNELELLAVLENMRLSSPHSNAAFHFAMRSACAVIAENFGYKDRNSWMAELKAAGLVEHKIDHEEESETARENYGRLMEKMRS